MPAPTPRPRYAFRGSAGRGRPLIPTRGAGAPGASREGGPRAGAGSGPAGGARVRPSFTPTPGGSFGSTAGRAPACPRPHGAVAGPTEAYRPHGPARPSRPRYRAATRAPMVGGGARSARPTARREATATPVAPRHGAASPWAARRRPSGGEGGAPASPPPATRPVHATWPRSRQQDEEARLSPRGGLPKRGQATHSKARHGARAVRAREAPGAQAVPKKATRPRRRLGRSHGLPRARPRAGAHKAAGARHGETARRRGHGRAPARRT